MGTAGKRHPKGYLNFRKKYRKMQGEGGGKKKERLGEVPPLKSPPIRGIANIVVGEAEEGVLKNTREFGQDLTNL